MSSYTQTPDGRYYRTDPGLEPEEITRQEFQAGTMGRGQRAVRSLGEMAMDQAAGLGEIGAGGTAIGQTLFPLLGMMDRLGFNPAAQQMREIQAQNDPMQRALTRADPLASRAGQAGALAVDLAIPAPIAASTARGVRRGTNIADEIIKRVPREAGLRDTALDAVEEMSQRIPFVGDQVRGARVGAARLAEARRIRGSLSAAADDAQRYMSGSMSADEWAAYTRNDSLTDPMKGYLNARDVEEAQSMRAIMSEISYRERTDPSVAERLIAGDRQSQAGAFANIRDDINRAYMRRIGADEFIKPEVETLGDNLTRISGEITGIEKRAGPIDVQELLKDFDEIERTRILTGDGKKALEGVKDQISTVGGDDLQMMDPEQYGIIRNRIEDAIRRRSRDPDTEVVEVLSEARDKIMDRMRRTLAPEDIARDRELRSQWGWTMSALNRQGAIGTDGINPRTLIGSKGVKDRMTKTGRSNDDFVRFLRTADELIKAIPGSSQTPEAAARAPAR